MEIHGDYMGDFWMIGFLHTIVICVDYLHTMEAWYETNSNGLEKANKNFPPF